MNILLPGGEPFLFPGSQVGCLLVHGLTGTPQEMRWMGEYLAVHGYTALGVRLFGHATRPEDLNRARWRDWLASVEDGYHLLRGACSHIVLMGLSLGGALSMVFATQFPVAGVVAMSTPIETPDPRARLLRPIFPLLYLVWRYIPKEKTSGGQDAQATEEHLQYPVYPTRGIAELHDLLAELRRALIKLHVPVLLIHDRGDDSVPASHAQVLYDRLGTSDKEILWLENGGHNIPRGIEREKAFEAAAAFVSRVTGSPA